jgi:hypothetical protein
MEGQEAGSALGYEQIIGSLSDNALKSVGIGSDQLAKANEVLNKLSMTNLALQQFGFYRKISETLKNSAKEAVEEGKTVLSKPKIPLGEEGTPLTEIKPPTETEASPELQQLQQGRQITSNRTPQQETQEAEQAQQADEVTDVTPRVAQPIVDEAPAFSSEARIALDDTGGETQSIGRSMLSRFSSLYQEAKDVQTALDNGMSRITQLRQQGQSLLQGVQDDLNSQMSQGRQFLQQGSDVIQQGQDTIQQAQAYTDETARAIAQEAGQNLVSKGQAILGRGQGLIDNTTTALANNEVASTALSKSQDLIKQGQDLVNAGKNEGLAYIEQGTEQLKQAQSMIRGAGEQFQTFQQAVEQEVTTRTQQVSDLAEQVASKVSAGVQEGRNIATAISTGDVDGAVQATQTVVKTAGKLAGDLGVNGGEEIASGLADAIPVVGEVVSAGLLLASLFSGIGEAFQPHDKPTITATQQYGV